MDRVAIETLLRDLGQRMAHQGASMDIELYGSAVLVLGYPCWPSAGDIDARWSPYDDPVIWPLIHAVSEDHHASQGWLNNDVSDITPEEGEWAAKLRYGGLTIKSPSEAYAMAQLVGALEKCTPEPPHGKHAQKFRAFQAYLGWDKDTILERCTHLAGPRGFSGCALSWLDNLLPAPTVPSPAPSS